MKLTIFTPTYNRAALLPRLFESLQKQTAGNFEWLVVDDGSVDETPHVMERLAAQAGFPLHYVRKENGGKHTAHNFALDYALGEWFFCVDSDDCLAENAIGSLMKHIDAAMEQHDCVLGLKSDFNGRLLCKPIEATENPVGLYTLVRKFGGGEYALAFRTEVLKQHPFPVFDGERFVTECVLYDKLEQEGGTVYPTQDILQHCEYQPEGLSTGIYARMVENPKGYTAYYSQRIELALTLKERMGYCLRYQAFCTLAKWRDISYTETHKFLCKLMYLPGIMCAKYYTIRAKRQ